MFLLAFRHFAIHYVQLEIQLLIIGNLCGCAAFARYTHDFGKEMSVLAKFDHKQFLLFGQLIVRFLLQQTHEERFDNVLHTGATFDLGVQIFDAKQLADGFNHTMGFQTVTWWLFGDVNFRKSELTEVIVEYGMIIAHMDVRQILGGPFFCFVKCRHWINRFAHTESSHAIAIAGDNECRMTSKTTQIATHQVDNFEFNDARVESIEFEIADWFWWPDSFARHGSARIASFTWNLLKTFFTVSLLIALLE